VTLPVRQVADPQAQQNFDAITRYLRWGQGSPEGRITASPGAIWLDTNGGSGTTLWVKETGTGDTGWDSK
jgi:Ca2+-binding RTX toxin-like protein